MCVIISKPEGKVIGDNILLAASALNPHGLGVVCLETGNISYYKSDEWSVLKTTKPFIAHFRYATQGAVNEANMHPFIVPGTDYVLFQNGTIYNLGDHSKTDAQHMAEIIGSLSPEYWGDVLEMTDCRWAMVNTKTLTVELFNEDSYIEDEGIMYSKDNVLDGHLVAVYGTLKQGYGNHRTMGSSRLVGKGTTYERYPMTESGIPFVYPEKGVGNNVVVEVYYCDKETLEGPIDGLEGHPRFYERRKAPILLQNGEIIEAWVYFYPHPRDKEQPLIAEYTQGYNPTQYSLYDNESSLSSWHSSPAEDDYSYDLNGSSCDKCGWFDTMWDEQNEELWCYNCNSYVTSQDIVEETGNKDKPLF